MDRGVIQAASILTRARNSVPFMSPQYLTLFHALTYVGQVWEREEYARIHPNLGQSPEFVPVAGQRNV